MDSIPAIISASGTLVLGIIGTLFVQRRLNKRADNASMQNNFQLLYAELRKEIGRLRDEQIEERRQWADERTRLDNKISKLQDELAKQVRTVHDKELEVTALNGKVDVLTSQLEFYRANPTMPAASKNITVTT